jgi:mRNA interferase MazF
MQTLKRGDVWWVSFETSVGGEIRKTRPAVIVSNNAANAVLNRVVIVPLTSRTAKVYPSEVLVQLDGKRAKAMANQITTAAVERVQSRIGALSPADVRGVEDAILQHLGIRR